MLTVIHRLSLLSLVVATLMSGLAFADATTDYNLALQFYKQGRWELAEESCREFLKDYPNHEQAPLAQLYLAQSLVHQQKFKPARDEFREFLQANAEHSERPLAMYRTGECSYFLGEHEQAVKELNAFLKDFSTHELAEWAWVYLGESEFRQNHMQQAATAFETYVAKYAQGALLDDAQFGLARCYELLDRKNEAIELYRTLASRPNSPRAPESQFNLGARLYDQGEFAKAAAAFSQVAESFPQSPLIGHAEMNAGYAFYQLREYDAAIDRFKKATVDENEAVTAGYWIGLSYKAAGQYDEAAKAFAETMEKHSESPLGEAIYFHWGHSELRSSKYESALTQFAHVYEGWPEGTLADDALYAASEAALRLGEFERTEALNAKFFELYPESNLKFAQRTLLARLRIEEGLGAEGDAKTTKLEEAVTAASSVANETPVRESIVAARLQWARALDLLGRPDDIPAVVSPILDDPADVHPLDIEAARLVRGKAYLSASKYDEAAKDFDAVLGQSSIADKVAALSGVIVANIELGQWTNVETHLSELKPLDADDAQYSQLCMRAGDIAFAKDSWTESAKFFGNVVGGNQGSPYHPAALSGLGHAQYELQDYGTAAKTFQSVLASELANNVLKSDATHLAALSLRLADDKVAAMAMYQQGITNFSLPADTADPTEEQLSLSLNAYRCAKGAARLAREQQEIKEADGLYQSAVTELKHHAVEAEKDLAPLINEWAEMHYSWAQTHNTEESYQQADKVYALLIKEAPETKLADDARLILAESLRFSGKLDEAIKAFEELRERPNIDPVVQQRTLIHLLDLYAKLGNWQQVEATALVMQQDFPNHENRDYVTFRYGEARLHAGDQEGALKALDVLRQDLALRLDTAPEWWPEVWLLLAETYLNRKEYANVEGALNDLRQRAPNAPVLYRGDLILGQRWENTAEWDKARSAYQQVLDNPVAQRTEAEAEAQFRIAETYLKQKNYVEAFKAYYKVVVGPKFPEWQSNALYQAGVCDKAQRNWEGAATSFRKLIEDFPESDSARKAETQLEEIRPFLKP
ncbi:MAG: tetratricopeptide repeat protein [Planctomycetaceae bacterium]